MPYLNLPDYRKRYFPPPEKSGRTTKQMFGKQRGWENKSREGKSIRSKKVKKQEENTCTHTKRIKIKINKLTDSIKESRKRQ